jgi:arsenate reductase (thioredoxin)
MRKQKVLFLCTQNSARSQMAEGLLRHLGGERFEVYSTGIDPIDEIHPCAIEAMREVGIDISDQQPKGLKESMGKQTFTTSSSSSPVPRNAAPRPSPGWQRPSRGSSRPRAETMTSPTTRCWRGSG